MTVPAIPAAQQHQLLDLVSRASQALGAATTAAEVLDARDMAAMEYTSAKAAARFAKAKGAHDELVAAAHRAMADAAEIEAQAKRRLADEYDAAQARGEVAAHGGERGNQHAANVPDGNVATVTDLGLTRKQVHEARQIRNAEAVSPGIVRRTLDQQLAEGKESLFHPKILLDPQSVCSDFS